MILRDADIINHDGTAFRGSVLIEGGLITAVGAIADADGHEVIDCRGKIVMPGLVNAHCHAPMSLFRSSGDDLPLERWLNEAVLPAEERLTPQAVYWGTLLAIAEMLKCGITAFGDMYFFLQDMAKAVGESGIRASLSRGVVAVGEDPEAAFSTRLADATAFYREYNGAFDGRLTVMLGAHALYSCAPRFLERIAGCAQQLGARIHMHISESEYEVAQSVARYGKSPVAVAYECGLFDCGMLAAHCVHVDENDIGLLAEKAVVVAHNPGSNLFLGNGIAPIRQMMNNEIVVALGTDGAACNNNLDIIEEMRLAALLQKGSCRSATALVATDVLSMATINGARALGLQNTGKILPGYAADVIILSRKSPHWHPANNLPSQLVYASSSADVDTVIAGGRMLMRGRELQTIDEERVYYEVAKFAH